jgi:hypothetical protein
MSTIVRTYYAAKGSRLNDEDARLIGGYIDTECEGVITPEEFVDKAKDAFSPLHPFLEWDDSVAAHKHRLDQARWMLRSIVVYDEAAPGEKVRAFHAVTLSDPVAREAYVSHQIVWQKPELIDQVVNQAYRELRSFANKYRVYKELEPLVKAVEAVINS